MAPEVTRRDRTGSHSRRTFLRSVSALSAATGTALLGRASAAGADGALLGRASAADADDSLPVRHSVASLRRHDPDDVLPTFREALRQMQALPASDPRSLDNVVAVHGSPQRFNLCEHGNWAFLPWHRAYLHFFEDICRELTGNEAFAVPYWNWVENPQLPGVFRGDDSNPLYDPTRTSVSTADSTIVGPDAIEPILQDPNFYRVIGGWAGTRADESAADAADAAADAADADDAGVPPATAAGPDDAMHFGSGALEQPAHDYVHVRVGGHMASGASPADPCFWTHHSTLDWLWWEWNARGHPNTDDPAWLTTAFDGHFVDRHGEPVEALTIADTLSLPAQSYTFDRRAQFEESVETGRAAGSDPSSDGRTTSSSGGTAPSTAERPGITADAIQAAQTATADVDLERIAQTTLQSDVEFGAGDSIAVSSAVPAEAFGAVLAGETPGRLWLTGREIDLPERGSFVTSVFLESAAGPVGRAKRESSLLGSWLLFRAPPMHPPQNYFVDVTDALRAASASGALSAAEPIRFRLVAEPLNGRDADGASVAADRLALEARQSTIDGEVVERGDGSSTAAD